jgi:PAS domain S-box-containing protein
MFEVSGVGKIEVEPGSGRFLRANAGMCKFVGYSEVELLDRSVYDTTYPEDRTIDQLCQLTNEEFLKRIRPNDARRFLAVREAALDAS